MLRNSDVAECAERLKLSDMVVKAVQRNYTAKAAHDHAVRNNKDATPLTAELAAAQQAESSALKALDKHRKEHGC